jgi:hypothetical protein
LANRSVESVQQQRAMIEGEGYHISPTFVSIVTYQSRLRIWKRL